MRVALRVTAVAAVGSVVAGVAVAIAAPSGPPRLPGGDSALAAAPRAAARRAADVRATPAPHKAQTAPPKATPPPPSAGVQVTGSPSGVKARGGALVNAATGGMLWSRDLDTERPIGSITKVMTALVVIRAGTLDRQIQVPAAVIPYVDKYQADSAGLHPGDVLTTQELLDAMLLPSGCDAAYTLATAYGPGIPAFLAKMNATAQQLHMTHTHFTSPDGLPYPTETSTFSTPADLVTLGLAAMKLPVFRAIVAQHIYQIPKGPGHHHYWWDNTNYLIGSYPGADGIKTGYTTAALHCLLFEVSREGLTLIGDVLGSPATGPASGAQAAARVLNWGFSLRRN
jgi:serine-type D-Ala-D-Ala carboxypeptidase (penicillin-binding protein 5/6)